MTTNCSTNSQVFTRQLCDAELIAKNGAKISVNTAILADICPYFSRSRDEKSAVRVTIINSDPVSRRLLEVTIKFAYIGQVELERLVEGENSTNDLLSFYCLSKTIDYPQLTAVIEKELHKLPITVENVSTVFRVASKQHLQWLRERCTQFLDDNSQHIVNMVKESGDSEKTKEIIGRFPGGLIMEVAKSDTFYANELDIFRVIQFWGELSQNWTVVEEAFKELRLQLISREDFYLILQETKLITAGDYFDPRPNGNKKRQKRNQVINTTLSSKKISMFSERSTNRIEESLVDRSLHRICNGKCGDVYFTDGTDYQYYAHRSVLANSCSYFEKLLKDTKTNEEVAEVLDLNEFCETSIKFLVDFICGEKLSLESLNDATIMDLFLLTKKIEFAELNKLICDVLNRTEANIGNVFELYHVANENENLMQLLETCENFIDNNANKVISNEETLKKMPIALLERVVLQKMDKEAFKALKQFRDFHPDIDLGLIVKRLPLHKLTMSEYIVNIRPSGLVSEKLFIEAHASNLSNKHQLQMVNSICKSHPTQVCKPSISNIGVKRFRNFCLDSVSVNDNYVSLNEAETLIIELAEEHVLNYITFRLFDEVMRMYNYEVKVSVLRPSSDQVVQVVRNKVDGRRFASKQEIVFKPRKVKFVQITSVDMSPLKINLKSIEAMMRPDLDSDAFTVSTQFHNGHNVIADLRVDEEAKRMYSLFNSNENEFVVMLRYPYESSSLELHFNSAFSSLLELWTKKSVDAEWIKRATVNGVHASLPTVVLFEKTLVSFFKLTGPKIKKKMKYIHCPATKFV